MNVIAIDPGQTTGIAILLDGKYLTYNEIQVEEVWKYLNTMHWDHVVCENFTTAGRISAYGLLTVRVIGGIQAIFCLKNIPLHMRMPQHRYSHQNQAKTMAKVIHEQDALAHLLSWMAKNG